MCSSQRMYILEVAGRAGAGVQQYANDTQAYRHCKATEAMHALTELVNTIAEIKDWMSSNRLKLNPSKTQYILSQDSNSLVRAYKTYVRPLLEYNSVVWSPYQICQINAIEAVQRAFTKRLPSLKTFTYPERLSHLKLQTLEHRRLITDLYTCYCIVYGHSSLKFDDFFTYSHRTSLRGHSKKLEIPLCNNNRSKNFFSSRVIHPWNSLPQDIISIPNPKLFKKHISELDLTQFLTIKT